MKDIFDRGEDEIEAIQNDPELTPGQKRAEIRAIERELGELEDEQMRGFRDWTGEP